MVEIMNAPKGVKSVVPERVTMSCPNVAPVTIHLTGKVTKVTVVRQSVNKPLNIRDT